MLHKATGRRLRDTVRATSNGRFLLLLAVLVGAVGWLEITWLGWQFLSLVPPRAGDDLRLLLDAAGRAAAGQPLYLPLPPGTILRASDLFYSYPPLVAQALVPLVGLPFVTILVGWAALATAGFLLVVRALDGAGRGLVRQVVIGLPYVFPFAVALLFGNADLWFPLVFGLSLLVLLRPSRRAALLAGCALALASAVKIYPALIALWWLCRWWREGRRGSAGTVLAAGVLTGSAVLLLSLAVGGTGPWLAYLDFLRSSAQAVHLVVPLNIGPSAQIALLLGGSETTARLLQFFVTPLAIGLTILAALWARDPIEGLAWAMTASFVVLPLTWFHYPAALVPFAVVALARRERAPRPLRVVGLLFAALVAAALAILAPVAVWLAVLLVLVALRDSRPTPSRGFSERHVAENPPGPSGVS